MSTNPDFVKQDDSNFTDVRYYTQFDPYYYVIDNRPLQDIVTNIKSARSGGGDAARRAVILNSLHASAMYADLYSPPNLSHLTGTGVITGLAVSVPSLNTLTIAPGAYYESRNVSTSVLDNVMKQALSTKGATFNLTAPATVGTSMIYTVEGEFSEITSTSMNTTTLPNLDKDNAFLPSTIIHGELRLYLNAGTAVASGTEVPPTTTVGRFPIYNVTLVQGTANPTKIEAHANAPYRKGLNQHTAPVTIAADPATTSIVNEMSVWTLPASGTSNLILPTFNVSKDLNPYKPVRVKLTFSSSATGGNIQLRLRYKGFISGEAHTTALTSGATGLAAVSGAINSVQTVTTTTAVVPVTEFAGLVSNKWVVNKEHLAIVLQRLGDDAGDTNTGTMTLLSAVLVQ